MSAEPEPASVAPAASGEGADDAPVAVHIHAPRPVRSYAIVDFNCWATPYPSRRRCGSYHAVVRMYEWYEPAAYCCACGTHLTGGGRLNDRRLAALREEHSTLVRDGAVLVRDGDRFVPRSGEDEGSA